MKLRELWEIETVMPTLWAIRHPDFYERPNTARAILWSLLILSAIGLGISLNYL